MLEDDLLQDAWHLDHQHSSHGSAEDIADLLPNLEAFTGRWILTDIDQEKVRDGSTPAVITYLASDSALLSAKTKAKLAEAFNYGVGKLEMFVKTTPRKDGTVTIERYAISAEVKLPFFPHTKIQNKKVKREVYAFESAVYGNDEAVGGSFVIETQGDCGFFMVATTLKGDAGSSEAKQFAGKVFVNKWQHHTDRNGKERIALSTYIPRKNETNEQFFDRLDTHIPNESSPLKGGPSLVRIYMRKDSDQENFDPLAEVGGKQKDSIDTLDKSMADPIKKGTHLKPTNCKTEGAKPNLQVTGYDGADISSSCSVFRENLRKSEQIS